MLRMTTPLTEDGQVPVQITITTELSREGLIALRDRIDQLLEGMPTPKSDEPAPSPARQVARDVVKANSSWERLSENTRDYLAACARLAQREEAFSIEDVAAEMGLEHPTVSGVSPQCDADRGRRGAGGLAADHVDQARRAHSAEHDQGSGDEAAQARTTTEGSRYAEKFASPRMRSSATRSASTAESSWLAAHLAIRKLLTTGRSRPNATALDASVGRARHDVHLQRLAPRSLRDRDRRRSRHDHHSRARPQHACASDRRRSSSATSGPSSSAPVLRRRFGGVTMC